MKKLNDTAITVLAIVSTILSYPSWLPVVLVANLFSSPAPAIDYTIFLIFCLALFFLCRTLYRLYNNTENARAALWYQGLFIFFLSLGIKFFLDGIIYMEGTYTLTIPYGVDVIFIIPINVFVNLKIAHRKIH